jgi:hypothetical protein
MSTIEGHEILTQDASSGRIHRRVLTDQGNVLTFEGDNLDAAGEYSIVGPEALDNAEPGDLCERCFPDEP